MLYASGYKGPAALIATMVVVFFGLFSEVSQSMEREDATVRHRSENSPVFQAALGSIGKLTDKAAAPSPAHQALAEAQGEVHRWEAEQQKKSQCHTCSEYSTRTIGSHLAQAQGRVVAAREQLTTYQAGNASALSSAIADAKTLEYDEDKHYGMIRLLKSLFGIEGIMASFLFSLVVIGTFEYIFHFIGTYVGNHRKALQLLGLNADGSVFEPAPAVSTLPVPANSGTNTDATKPLSGMLPVNHFARDWMRMDYSSNSPVVSFPGYAQPMSGVTPDLSVLAGSLSGLTGKVQRASTDEKRTGTLNSGSGTVGTGDGKYLTGKAEEGVRCR